MTTATTTPTTEIEKAKPKFAYTPLAPIGAVGNLKQMLEGMRDSVAAVIASHVTPERLYKTFLTAVNKNPDLLKCTQSSIMQVVTQAAELGLDLSGTLGEAYAVPFNNKIKANGQWVFVMQATLIPGYRGLMKLARQSGEVSRIEAEIVCTNDRFVYRKGTNFAVEFEPMLHGDRGPVMGAYALIAMRDGSVIADYMTEQDIERVRQSAKSKDSPAWVNHWNEMGRKSVLRRCMKYAPLSADKSAALLKAAEIDDADYTYADRREPSQPRRSGAATVRDALGLTADPTPEPIDMETGEIIDGEGGIEAEETDTCDPRTRAAIRTWCDANGHPEPTDADCAMAETKWLADTTKGKPTSPDDSRINWGKYLW